MTEISGSERSRWSISFAYADGVRFPLDQLEALVAVVDRGTFAAAARALGVTQSAISQRIKALESAAGCVLLVRASPCRPTEEGTALVRFGRQVILLDQEAARSLEAGAGPVRLPVAVSADSLGLWFDDVFAVLSEWEDVVLELFVEDQGHSLHLLRTGAVAAVVTSDPQAVQGCSVTPLGAMRYLPVATPYLADRHRRGRGVDWARIPVVRFNEVDDLQALVLRHHGVAGHDVVPTHRVPSTESFAAAVRAGLGWGALPQQQATADLAVGRLVRLPGTRPVDVPLYWQRWKLHSPALDRLTTIVRDAAADLRPLRRSSNLAGEQLR